MKEEDNILRKAGVKNPFKVPDGYFERITSEIMDRLPERQSSSELVKPVTLWDKVKPWVYMAAMFAGAALIIRVASSHYQDAKTYSVATDDTELEMEYIDAVIDNSMLDDYSLYIYLADGELEYAE